MSKIQKKLAGKQGFGLKKRFTLTMDLVDNKKDNDKAKPGGYFSFAK
jgi:hypothetical protein